MTRPPPSLLPGSDGTRSPGFKRYYEAAKTSGLLSRHSVCHVAPRYLGFGSLVRSSSRGNHRADARVLLNRFHPPLPVRCPKDTFGSPKFPANPSDLCRALGLRLVPCARSIAALGCCPRKLLPRGHQTILTFVARSHGLSHGCLRFVPSSRTTTQNSLPVADQPCRVGLSIPPSSLGEFHTFRAPLSQGFSWREAILIMAAER